MSPEGHRCGLVALVGRPNVGKSTLVNRLVGEKVTIVTKVPGTTRTTVRAVVTRDDAQVVLLDTPGLAKPRTAMGNRMNQLVRDTWASVDVVVLLVDAEAGIGGGDEYLVGELAALRTPVVTVVNKTDTLAPEALLPVLDRVARMTAAPPFVDVVPVSALAGDNVERLVDVLVDHLPEAPRLFASGRVTDQPEAQLAAEIVREKVIADLRKELPHSVAVTVDGIEPDPARVDLVHIDAVIHVERDSQKGIIIGRGGGAPEGGRERRTARARGAARDPRPSDDAGEGREGLAAGPAPARTPRAVTSPVVLRASRRRAVP